MGTGQGSRLNTVHLGLTLGLIMATESARSFRHQESRHRTNSSATEVVGYSKFWTTTIAVLLVTLLSVSSCFSEESRAKAQLPRTVCQQLWSPVELIDTRESKLNVIISAKGRLALDNDIRFLHGDQEISSFHFDLYPVSLLALQDGNIASLWNTGGAYYRLIVFSYERGSIKQVLNESSKFYPEFVYSSSSVVTGCQRIVIAKTSWQRTRPDGESEEIAASANLYTWDEKTRKYCERKGVPWQDRLKEK